MLDRINMTCIKCGSNEGIVTLVSDPDRLPDVGEGSSFYLMMEATCLRCYDSKDRWVAVQTLHNLLHSVCMADKVAADRVYQEWRMRPSQWKLWKASDSISERTRRLRRDKVFRTLLSVIPDSWAWFNGKDFGGWSVVSPDRIQSRHVHYLWLRDRSLFAEWQSLWATIRRSGSDRIHSPEVCQRLQSVLGHSLAK